MTSKEGEAAVTLVPPSAGEGLKGRSLGVNGAVANMETLITEAFLDDLLRLNRPLAHRCQELLRELRSVSAAELRTRLKPGWRLHQLVTSPFVSLSLDMNFRVLAQMEGGRITLHRAVKHDLADRASVNRSGTADSLAETVGNLLQPSEVYGSLMALGVSESDAAPFEGCESDDDLIAALAEVPKDLADLTLQLYELSAITIPKAKYRVLDADAGFEAILTRSQAGWDLFLHPSQQLVVDLPPDMRVAVSGSAGTGKTIAAWYRCRQLASRGVKVGFVAPSKSAYEVSREALRRLISGNQRGYFLVPGNADEILQLAHAVDHIIIDEAQEVPAPWLTELGAALLTSQGATIFFDLNQLSGNIPTGDRRRYEQRMQSWRQMLNGFAGLRQVRLSVNYRNSREIARYYLEMLSHALPVLPDAELPAFEAGDVQVIKTTEADLRGVLAHSLRQLTSADTPEHVGVALLPGATALHPLAESLRSLGFPISSDLAHPGIVVAAARDFRGHERRAMVIISPPAERIARNYGAAVSAYIAMSRAVAQLIILEVTDGRLPKPA